MDQPPSALEALDRAHHHALAWLSSLDTRPVPPRASIEAVVEALGPDLPEQGSDPADVVDSSPGPATQA